MILPLTASLGQENTTQTSSIILKKVPMSRTGFHNQVWRVIKALPEVIKQEMTAFYPPSCSMSYCMFSAASLIAVCNEGGGAFISTKRSPLLARLKFKCQVCQKHEVLEMSLNSCKTTCVEGLFSRLLKAWPSLKWKTSVCVVLFKMDMSLTFKWLAVGLCWMCPLDTERQTKPSVHLQRHQRICLLDMKLTPSRPLTAGYRGQLLLLYDLCSASQPKVIVTGSVLK